MAPVPTAPVPWSTIHGKAFVSESNCWTTCGGGFCCSNNNPDYQFQLIPTHGTTLIYLEQEYQWLVRHGTAPGPDNLGTVPNVLTFDFGGPQPLTLVQMPCHLLGKCTGIIDKPLLCKLYPMLPILDIDGNLETIYPASVFDLTVEVRGFKTPCKVLDKRKEYFAKWQASGSDLECLRHPCLILYFQAAKHFADVYSEKLRSNEVLKGLTGKAFWKTWELQYLAGELLDTGLLAQRICSSYERLCGRHGRFLDET